MGAGPPHHVVVWLFSNLYWQFEFTPLRHRFPSLRILRPKRRNSLRLRSAVLSRQEYLGVLKVPLAALNDGGHFLRAARWANAL
jgi:hypothetical protein